MAAVSDLKDTRVLIPRVRRALEGPGAVSGSAAVAAGSFSDDVINAVIADAIAGVILYTGGLFGHALNVLERDTDYMAPIAWEVDPALTEPEGTLIAAQAALDAFYTYSKGLKVSQRIADEGQEWEYSLSATLVADQLKGLRAERDKALEAVLGAGMTGIDTWVNFIAVRDTESDMIMEPWLYGGGGGQSMDPRFGTLY